MSSASATEYALAFAFQLANPRAEELRVLPFPL
jgi:hypothetical protein